MPDPDPHRFLRDLEAKPATLRALADTIEDMWPAVMDRTSTRVVIGMGSSRYAGSVFATRWQQQGIAAWSELASAAAGAPPASGTIAIGVSASGTTPETVEALTRHRGRSTTVAITNHPRSPLSEVADLTIPMLAAEETGGVACRTYQHTLALLAAMDDAGAASLVRRTAEATEDLLERRAAWLPAIVDALADGPATFTIAPAERLSSAEQGALMLREGPRRTADACEAGDWLHVDLYLTKPLDYRALVFAGSRFEPSIMEWMNQRGGRVVAVGGDIDGAVATVRYRHDDDLDVALLTEVLVAELVAQAWWSEGR
ncbi:MAG TPA: SIS domain-containing protein [Actinomycetota bacterium]